MTIQEMKRIKKELSYTNQMLADLSGVPLGTVQKVFAGTTRSPRYETLRALESVLKRSSEKKENAERSSSKQDSDPARSGHVSPYYSYDISSEMMSMVRESDAMYASDPGQGSYTLADYYALPDDRRVELIDGVIYDMSSPLMIHQAILGRLYHEFVACADRHPECELFMAPSDVRLDNDDRTMVQPDLYIVCGRTDQDNRRLNGAPDLACEILSPSSRSHDMLLKLNKYRNAGVREYWIVDSERLQVLVFDFEHGGKKTVYSFHDKIPVSISNGECEIDFEKIFVKIERYL